MKHVLIAFLFFSPLIVFANIRGGEEQIFLQKKKIKDGHTEYYDPADMPEVYYDRGNQEIILVADGFVSSYDVDIVSLSTLQIVLFTAVNGYGDTIDVSTLPDDDYKIVISTPYNNIYEGYFTNY
jgi:hypothetical protein